MPELPEVEFTARQLRSSVVRATISGALVFWERAIGHPDLATFLLQVAGRRIEAIRRRGKYLVLDLHGDLFLSIHRRMTGNLFLLPAGWEIDTSLRETDPAAWSTRGPSFFATPAVDSVEGAPYSVDLAKTWYCRVCFNLADGRRLLYTDPRKFGRIELWTRDCESVAFKGLGPEPLSTAFSTTQLAQALAGRKSAIKQVLVAQEVVAGLGNIYADEALYFASIHPLRRADLLSPTEIELLHQGIVAVLTLGIEHGGTSFSGYRDLWGEAGDNYNHVKVYQQDGKPCLRCGALIERIVVAQRGTHFCPGCQKLTVE
jgi:formamidopyrimidine-DNA glycosylase